MKRQRAKAAILIDVTVQISSKALAKAQRPLESRMDVKSEQSRSESERVEELCQWLGDKLEDDLTQNCGFWAKREHLRIYRFLNIGS
jgi:cell division protein FtsX